MIQCNQIEVTIYMKIYKQFERESGITQLVLNALVKENPNSCDKMPTFNTRVLSSYCILLSFFIR